MLNPTHEIPDTLKFRVPRAAEVQGLQVLFIPSTSSAFHTQHFKRFSYPELQVLFITQHFKRFSYPELHAPFIP
jgi:hypothetical protein